MISEIDPQAAWSTKEGPGRFSYETNYLVDDRHAIIVDVEASPARLSQEIVAAKAMLERSRQVIGFAPESLAADKSYGTAPFLAWLLKREVTPYIPVLDRASQTDGKLTRDAFTYDADRDSFTCPTGHELTLRSITQETGVKRYKPGSAIAASARSSRSAPTRRFIIRLVDEEARETVRALADTEAFHTARGRRKKVEMLFAHLKRHLKLRRLRLRGLSGATEEFLLAATAQNLRRLASSHPPDGRSVCRRGQKLALISRAGSATRPAQHLEHQLLHRYRSVLAVLSSALEIKHLRRSELPTFWEVYGQMMEDSLVGRPVLRYDIAIPQKEGH